MPGSKSAESARRALEARVGEHNDAETVTMESDDGGHQEQGDGA